MKIGSAIGALVVILGAMTRNRQLHWCIHFEAHLV
jgi:hypothetical protein